MGCIETSYAKPRQWLVEAAFESAAARHVDRVPPSSWTLDAYPRDFPDALAAQSPADPEVRELAWLDMALGEAFVAADAEPVDPASLGAVDWDRAALRFTASLDLATLISNACAIWSALSAGEMPPAATLLPGPGALLVWRADGRSHFRAIDLDERDALLLARAGEPFGGLCARAAAQFGDEAGVVAASGWLARWLGDRLIIAIEEQGRPSPGRDFP